MSLTLGGLGGLGSRGGRVRDEEFGLMDVGVWVG